MKRSLKHKQLHVFIKLIFVYPLEQNRAETVKKHKDCANSRGKFWR